MDRLTQEKEAQVVAIGYWWHDTDLNYRDKYDNVLCMSGYKDEWTHYWEDEYGEEQTNSFDTFQEMIDWFTPYQV
jgi:hypothetical protein